MISKRIFIGGSLALFLGAVAWSQATRLPFDGKIIDPPTAYKLAGTKEIILLDIRRPDEWEKTGSGKGTHRLDMRRNDFIAVLDKLVKGNRSMPVALICARGVRSNLMSQRLSNAGYTNIIDVPEGMLGSKAGPGWIKHKLPLDRS